ncbi:MAG TPA: hypothetical protein ENN38_04855 [Actinobacteria bacterium]|nr:hypothetical protein [Actinomycetota bacterium]
MMHSLNDHPVSPLLNEQSKIEELFEEYLDKAIAETLLLAKKIQTCKACRLHALCNEPLPGAGYPLADILVLKEAVTKQEDAERVAFFGEIGEALRSGFKKLGLDITDVYGTNAVKCSVPLKDINETNIKACKEHLETEIEILQPRIILAMGEFSIKALNAITPFEEENYFNPGKIINWGQGIKVIMTHSSQDALRNQTFKKEFWSALKLLKNYNKNINN